MTALGIDYGGTHTKFLLVSQGGEELARADRSDGQHRRAGDRVARFLASAPADAFGVTVAGTLDPATGIVGRSTNLPWLDGTAPAEVLSARLGIPGNGGAGRRGGRARGGAPRRGPRQR